MPASYFRGSFFHIVTIALAIVAPTWAQSNALPRRMCERINRTRVDHGSPSVAFALNTEAKITASDGEALDEFGWSVAISGDTVIVGVLFSDDNGTGSGSAYIFQRDVGGMNHWGQVAKIVASDGAANDRFGISVALSGDTALVGAAGDDDLGGEAGSAYIYSRNKGGIDNWGEVTKLIASDGATNDRFGISVALSGNTAIVGANGDDDNGRESGSAYIFRRAVGGVDNWGEAAKIVASDGAVDDGFGGSVAVNGDTAIVGANGDDDNGAESGSAYVYRRAEGGLDNWGEVAKTIASDGEANDSFGSSVAISGNSALVGARNDDDNGGGSGSVYAFERNAGGADNWGEMAKITASGGAADDSFGIAVALSGDIAIVGANGDDDNGAGSGAAYVYGRDEGGVGNWGEVTKLVSSDGAADDSFGVSVAVSDEMVIVGARLDDDRGTDAGSAYMYFETPPCVGDEQCADGVFCNGVERCVDTVCQAGTPPCSDGVACTTDSCTEATLRCDSVPDDGACDDGQFCNGVELCHPTADCQSGDNPCPGLACDEGVDECFDCADDADCEDGVFCNGPETCSGGVCQSPGSPCVDPDLPFCNLDLDRCVICLSTGDCPDDGDACTRDVCDGGECTRLPDVVCPAGSQCDPSDGECKACLSSEDCVGGVFCLLPEGVCGICASDSDCNDGNPCTDDTCAAAICTNSDNSAPCNDELFCNGQDTCAGGSCFQHAGSPCDVGEICDEKTKTCACIADAGCDDLNECNGIETCDTETRECLPGIPIDCDDGDDCNGVESCDPVTGDCIGGAIDDCDGSGVADVCELARCGGEPGCDDCDGNGDLDRCDIAGGRPDVNGDGVLDQCEQPCTDNASCSDSNPCSFDQCIDNLCWHDLGAPYGDVAGGGGVCGPHGEVALVDILAILNAFEGRFANGCEMVNMDLAGKHGSCVSDGVVDLLDILAVLDAFQGIDRCCAGRPE